MYQTMLFQGYRCRLRMKGFHSSSGAFPIKKHCFNSSMEFINMPHANRNKLLARVWLLERHDRSSSLILSTNKHTGDLTYCIWIYFLLLVHLPINRVDLENEMIYGKR